MKVINYIKNELRYFFKYKILHLLHNINNILVVSIPITSFITGMTTYMKYSEFKLSMYLLIPGINIIISLIIKLLVKVNNVSADDFPVASKRYTEEMIAGEISIRNNELQEIILYLYEVENYIERRGKMKQISLKPNIIESDVNTNDKK